MPSLFPKVNNTQDNSNNKRHKRELNFTIDERELEKEIERKIDTAMSKALKRLNGK